MVLKELYRVDEEAQKNFVKEVPSFLFTNSGAVCTNAVFVEQFSLNVLCLFSRWLYYVACTIVMS